MVKSILKNEIGELCNEIRQLASSPVFIENIGRFNLNWDLIWAAMDTIEDTALAIDSYKNKSNATNQGTEYLKVYGLFQAIFMQQDAVRNFAKGFNIEGVDISTDPSAKEVRELRNKYFGHHKYKREGLTTYHGIARVTVGEDSIMAWTYPNFSSENIDLKDAIAVNRKYIASSLNKILTEIRTKRSTYVKKFSNKLSEDTQTYSFEKIYSWVYGDTADRAVMSGMGLKIIRQEVAKIEQGLNERYENISDIGDAERTIRKARFALDHLEEFFKEKPNGANGDFGIEIHADALESCFKELIETCIGVNKEFEY